MKETILLGHGSGGKMMAELIRNHFVRIFDNSFLRMLGDSANLTAGNSELAFTTDSYVVDPIFFPGGDIGKLAVCGTVNDIAVSGAEPLFLSASFILEEGFSIKSLDAIIQSMKEEADKAGIKIVTGDTKVVNRGKCDKIFITTSGIGVLQQKYNHISGGRDINSGDGLIINGEIGDHSIAILGAREGLEFEEVVISDCASLNHMIRKLKEQNIRIKFMRDITRGGLATILSEVSQMSNLGVVAEEEKIPIREVVRGTCEIYGFDPLYLANEGKVLILVDADDVEKAIEVLRKDKYGKNASIIGEVTDTNPGKAVLKSVIGGKRILDKLAGEQLPRIC
ncbi:hydrogenase expression/formation protein HypE [Bacteroidota bacterium]